MNNNSFIIASRAYFQHVYGYRRSNLGLCKYRETKGIGHGVYGSTTKDLLECTGISMAIQVPLLIIRRRRVSTMSGVFPEP